MAGAAIGALLTTVASLVAEEISLAWGVKKQLNKLATKLKEIQALLSDAQSKQITGEVMKLWLKKLQSTTLDAQIVLDEFSYQVLRQKIECHKRDKVRSCFSCSNPVFLRLKMAHKIKDVLSSLDELYAESDKFGLKKPMELINSLSPNLKEIRSTRPYVEDSKIVGRDDDVSEVIKLLTGSDSEYREDLPVITILGMGGQGKTTVAQLVFKSDAIESYFDKTVWVCVSDDFSVKRLLAEMHSPTETNYQSATEVGLVNKLKDQFRGKKYLLVLDDVWNENGREWEAMRSCLLAIGGSKGSKILATTRGKKVASAMRTLRYHQLGKLSDEQSWELFTKCAFVEGEATRTSQLADIGRRILKRCGGVPLAIKIIGGLLYLSESESDWSMIEKNEMWSEFDEGVLSVIKLSYDHLPSLPLKQCFAYCAIFEKDAVLKKDKLIQLWMAQGLLNVRQGSNLQMEDLGNNYLNTLLTSSLLQGYPSGYCRMHDLVHDVAVQVSENYCFLIKDSKAISNNEIEAVHVSIHSSESERGMWKCLKGVLPSKLRTLYLKGVDLSDVLFENLPCLSVLIIENENVVELPNSIGKLKHLRFLDVIRTGIRMLPKFLTKLYHLQTLRVHSLTEVPKGFGNLINLRHIYFNGEFFSSAEAECVFIGIGQLTNLQTLPYFKVGKCKGCGIEELEYLDNLSGTLKIFCLQNVGSNASAAKSNLWRKSNIQNLELHWDDDRMEGSDVMEGLKPPSNVKRLTIKGYRSQKWPSWAVSENHLFLLRDLVELKLIKLDKCETLPSLGDLPFLEVLWIEELNNVKCIGKEFYGSKVTLFPALKRLRIERMRSLVEWSDAIGITSTVQVQVFPSLEVMEVQSLPKLSVFPNLGTLPSLEVLMIRWLNNVKCIGKEFYGVDCIGSTVTLFPALKRLRIEGMRSLVEWSDAIGITPTMQVQVFPSLEEMRVVSLPKLSVFPNLGTLPSLRELTLEKLDKCETLPSLGDLPFLEVLSIYGLDNVKCIGKEFYGVDCIGSKVTLFPALKRLEIRGMRSLVEWSDAIGITPTMRVQVFPSLEVMWVDWLPQLRVFPNLGTLPSLRELTLWNLTIVAPHGEWNRGVENEMSPKKVEIGSDAQYYFPSLRSLYIDGCEKLSAPLCSLIPSCAPLEELIIDCNPGSWPKDLQHLTSLRDLTLGSWGSEDVDVDVEVDCFPWPCHSSVSLTSLNLIGSGLPKVTSIPHEIQQVATLRSLKIEGFDGLEDLPEWMGDLERLEQLNLEDCKNLKQLPSVEAMQRLSNLKELRIRRCRILKERCRKEISGSEWPKIAHIPEVRLDD